MTRSRMFLTALSLAACLATTGDAWALKVGRLTLETHAGRYRLKVATDGAVRPALQALDKKLLMVIPGGQRSMTTLKVGRSPLRQIRFGREGKDLRVVLDLDRDVAAKVVASGAHGFVVDLGPVVGHAVKAAAPAPQAKAPKDVKEAEGAGDALDPALAGYTCRVVDLALSTAEDHSELVVSADGPASYKPSVKEGGRLVSLLFMNASLAWSGDAAKLKDDSVESVAVQQLSEGGQSQVRLDVRLTQKLDYSLQRDQNQLVLRLARPQKAVATPKSGDLNAAVSVNVQDADLVGVVKTLAEQAGFEYQFSGSLLALQPPASLVTAKIVNRPFHEVIDTLLAPATANYIQQGNTLYFGSSTEIDSKKERLPLVQRTYAPKNVTVVQALALLKAEFKRPDQANLANSVASIDPRDPNGLLLVGTSDDVAQVLQALARLDVSVDDGGSDGEGGNQIRTQVYRLRYLDPTSVFVTGSITQLYQTGETPPQMQPDALSHSIVITTQMKYHKKIRRLLDRLDVRPPQVNIEGKIVEVDQNASAQLGINWSATSNTNAPSGLASSSAAFQPGFPTAFTSQLTYATLQNGYNIAATLQALINASKADIVSAPNITTDDNVPATIGSTDNIVIQSTTQTISNGVVSTTTTYTPFIIPLTLAVTPRVTLEDQRVDMIINFSLTSQTGNQVGTAPPPTSLQQASTRVSVHSGDTAVIGGLVRQTINSSNAKVPVLGDIPLLGMLFRYKSETKAKKEVVIFITPTIVQN